MYEQKRHRRAYILTDLSQDESQRKVNKGNKMTDKQLQVKRDIIIEMECRMKEMRADSVVEIAAKEEIKQLQAENIKMREALDKIARLGNEPFMGNSVGNNIAIEALSTPAYSLQEHDNELIERCAVVCDACKYYHNSFDAGLCSDAIRELKGKP